MTKGVVKPDTAALKVRLLELLLDLRHTVRILEHRIPERGTWQRTECERWETWNIQTAKLFAHEDWLLYEIKRYKAMLLGRRPQPYRPEDPDAWKIAISKREKPDKKHGE